MWRNLPDFWAEIKTQNPVTSVAVMFFVRPDFSILESFEQGFLSHRCIVPKRTGTQDICAVADMLQTLIDDVPLFVEMS